VSEYVEPEILTVRHSHRGAYWFLMPALAVLAVFFLVPLLWMFRTGLTDYDPVTATSRGLGLGHYTDALSNPPLWRAVLNTAYFTGVYVPLTLVLAGAVALLLIRVVRSRPVLKAIFCAPFVVPTVGAALIWRSAYLPFTGSIDRLLSLAGVGHGAEWAGWLAAPYLAMPCIALMCVWRDLGFFALILLSALTRIPRDAYELARLDGANSRQMLRHVTLPMSLGTVGLCFVMLLINVQNVFQEIFVMTEDGGPANWTVNLPFLVYHRAYIGFDWSRACALSALLLAVTVVLILIQNRMLNRRLDWS